MQWPEASCRFVDKRQGSQGNSAEGLAVAVRCGDVGAAVDVFEC